MAERKTRISLVSLAVAGSLLLSGCTLTRMKHAARKQEVTVEPGILAVTGDQVVADLKAAIPLKVLRKNHTYAIRTYYEYQDQQEALGTLAFTPGDFLYEDGKATIHRQLSFDFTPEKARGRLMVQGVAKNAKGRERTLPPREVAPGVLTTSKLMVRNDDPAFAPETYSQEQDGPLVFTFFFNQGSAKLRPYVGTHAELMEDFLASKPPVRRVTIEASHSPEPEDATDETLPTQRAQAVKTYYGQLVQKNRPSGQAGKLPQVPVRSLRKTWEPFLERVKQSALPPAQVAEIEEVVKGTDSFEEKETRLRELPAYEYLQRYVYPTLRFAELSVDYERNRKRDYEIYLLSKRIVEKRVEPSALTAEELQYAATLTPLLSEKKAIYEAAVEKTGNWKAYHNLGMVYLEMARKEYRATVRKNLLQQAITHLTYAGHRNPTAEVFYNLAAGFHLRGDYLEALHYYDYAIRLGGPLVALQKIFLDKAALEIEVGQFDDALASLAYAGSGYYALMNKGLSYLLKENYEGAAEFYGKALEERPQDPTGHYALAVVHARTGEEEALGRHLRQALRADPTLKPKAIDDLEFRDYKKSTYFQEAFR